MLVDCVVQDEYGVELYLKAWKVDRENHLKAPLVLILQDYLKAEKLLCFCFVSFSEDPAYYIQYMKTSRDPNNCKTKMAGRGRGIGRGRGKPKPSAEVPPLREEDKQRLIEGNT